jgi:hypothetical protein
LWEKKEDEDAKKEWDALTQEQRDEWGFEYELMVTARVGAGSGLRET